MAAWLLGFATSHQKKKKKKKNNGKFENGLEGLSTESQLRAVPTTDRLCHHGSDDLIMTLHEKSHCKVLVSSWSCCFVARTILAIRTGFIEMTVRYLLQSEGSHHNGIKKKMRQYRASSERCQLLPGLEQVPMALAENVTSVSGHGEA
eukprot:2647223-Amphidinium_carterae.1